MKRKIVSLILVVILLCTSSIICYFLGYQKSASRTEDIIANEIAILKKYLNIPNSNKISAKPNTLNSQTVETDILYWYYNEKDNILKKLIITKELEIAYEEVSPDCNKR